MTDQQVDWRRKDERNIEKQRQEITVSGKRCKETDDQDP